MNVGIFGVSYCGSTLLSYILGYHSKIFSVGESHWLLERSNMRPNHDHSNCVICQIKNIECDFYTPEFKKTLQWNNLISQISKNAKEKFGKDICVFSDKNIHNYQRTNVNKEITKAIMLFKRPEGYAKSFITHDSGFHEGLNRRGLLQHSQRNYNECYRNYIKYINDIGIPILYVFYDNLCINPEKEVRRICEFMCVNFEPKMLKYWENENLHQIGGNGSPRVSFMDNNKFDRWYKNDYNKDWYKKIQKNIKLDDRWKTFLTDEEKSFIKNHNSTKLFNKLLEGAI